MSLPSTRRTLATSLLSQRMRFRSTMKEKRSAEARRSKTMTARIVTKETMRVVATIAADVVDAEEEEDRTTITRVIEIIKMVATTTSIVVVEAVPEMSKKDRDLKLKMVTRSLETDLLEITTETTKMERVKTKATTITIKVREAVDVEEVVLTSTVTDPNVLTTKEATGVDPEEDVLEGREVVVLKGPTSLQLKMEVTNNDHSEKKEA